MKIYHKWKRNEPDTVSGESITVTITYCSFDKGEIDELQKKMPNGVIVMETDKTEPVENGEEDKPTGQVRCMNCRYRMATDSPSWDYFCRRHNRNTDENDYCSDGEPC